MINNFTKKKKEILKHILYYYRIDKYIIVYVFI